MAKRKLIIDTDPGCDDILAMLLALGSDPEVVEIMLISVTYGNVDAQNCLRNVLSMFHVIDKEMSWRRSQGLPEGFELLKRTKPIVAVGATTPLGEQSIMADFFHGVDGLGNVHETHPHHSLPSTAWKHLFEPPTPPEPISTTAESVTHESPSTVPDLFTPAHHASPDLILSLLSSNPADTISLIAIGPLTNYAIAASREPFTFLRAKELLVMGGAIDVPGNITPMAEFNCLADALAAAKVYSLTSPTPSSTLPLSLPYDTQSTQIFPKPLNLILFPLDITTPHELSRRQTEAALKPLISRQSPLAEWVSAFLEATFQKTESLYHSGKQGAQSANTDDVKSENDNGNENDIRGSVSMALHDPVTVWYAISSSPSWRLSGPEDIRVETDGQWTRGMHVVDRRALKQLKDDVRDAFEASQTAAQTIQRPEPTAPNPAFQGRKEVRGDSGNWLQRNMGNRVRRCIGTPGDDVLAKEFLETVFGVGGS